MTTFFNKKEEVIDLQLTPFGESLMSIGQLKPVYYAFFDDDILYDASGSAGITEVQNDVEPRIQDNTLNMKSQAVYSGIESNLSPLIGVGRYGGGALLVPGLMELGLYDVVSELEARYSQPYLPSLPTSIKAFLSWSPLELWSWAVKRRQHGILES